MKSNLDQLHNSVCKGRDIPRDVPGQTGTGRPVVPVSGDKKSNLVPVSRCPGTRAEANVPGQIPLFRPVPGQNNLNFFKKKDQISHFRTSFLCFRTSFPVLERPFLFQSIPFLFQNVLFCSVPFCPASRPGFWLSRPVPDFGCPDPSRPLARFLACPVVPLSRDNDGISVPLSRKVSLSRPVGNANINPQAFINQLKFKVMTHCAVFIAAQEELNHQLSHWWVFAHP